MLRNHLAFISALTLASVCSAQQVYRVADSAAPGGDGLAWGSAFDDLQAALGVVVAGDEIWVADGLYTPSPTDADASFVMIDGVSMFGGFAGDETQRDQRDPSIHVVRLSGDIGQDDTFNPYLINSANSGHIIDASAAGVGTVIDGFTIEYGAYGVNGDGRFSGGGIYCVGGSPTINGCVIQFCYSAFSPGGGAYFRDANPVITNTVFQSNYGHLSNGAGVYLVGSTSAVIEDCQFLNNTVVFASPDGSGGGIAHQSTGTLTIRRSLFEGNVVRPFFSIGDDVGYGGGIFSFDAPLVVEDSIFKSNKATFGGGISAWNEAKIVNCLFEQNIAQVRETSNGGGGGVGGGFISLSFVERDMYLENCTFVNNHSKENGGAAGGWNSNMVLSNCVFFGNTGWNPEFQGYFREEIGGNFDLSYCLVPGIFGPPALGEDLIEIENLPGCIDANPMFVGEGSYRLSVGSPAIDAGTNAAWTSLLTTDLDGNPRFVDDPDTVDTGAGGSPVIDMGAYEYQVASSCLADLTGDGLLNFFDVSAFLAAFTAEDPMADFTGDGLYNFFDVSAFLAAFSAGCP